jgi:hypothetical protein
VAATTITIENGEKISFWNSAWIQDLRPKDDTIRLHNLKEKE